MAATKSPHRITHAEIKAGVFLTFCLALFVAMLFVLGKFGKALHEKQTIQVVFSEVNALRREAPISLNGMEVGRVKQVKILRLNEKNLAKFPTLNRKDLSSLPLSDAERESLKPKSDAEIDAATRVLLQNRSMVLLTLELVSENDTQRFRLDDEYHIAGSIMGDSALAISSGAGAVVPPGFDKYLLGVGGDMYTDLSKSVEQVKDMLGSMAEIVGGDADHKTIQEQLLSFDNFTGKLDTSSESMLSKLPLLWEELDTRLKMGGETMLELQTKIEKMKPELLENLTSADKAISEMRQNASVSIDEVHKKIVASHKDLKVSLVDWKKLSGDYRESIPSQVHSAREWSDHFVPTVDKIDLFFTRADESLTQNSASTKASLLEMGESADAFEEKTYRLKRWPWAMANKSEDDVEKKRVLEWQFELARRQYLELRAELERVRRGLANVSSGDKARVERIEQIIREADPYYGANASRTGSVGSEVEAPPPHPSSGASGKKGRK